jgi:hypothetical protein
MTVTLFQQNVCTNLICNQGWITLTKNKLFAVLVKHLMTFYQLLKLRIIRELRTVTYEGAIVANFKMLEIIIFVQTIITCQTLPNYCPMLWKNGRLSEMYPVRIPTGEKAVLTDSCRVSFLARMQSRVWSLWREHFTFIRLSDHTLSASRRRRFKQMNLHELQSEENASWNVLVQCVEYFRVVYVNHFLHILVNRTVFPFAKGRYRTYTNPLRYPLFSPCVKVRKIRFLQIYCGMSTRW